MKITMVFFRKRPSETKAGILKRLLSRRLSRHLSPQSPRRPPFRGGVALRFPRRKKGAYTMGHHGDVWNKEIHDSIHVFMIWWLWMIMVSWYLWMNSLDLWWFMVHIPARQIEIMNEPMVYGCSWYRHIIWMVIWSLYPQVIKRGWLAGKFPDFPLPSVIAEG